MGKYEQLAKEIIKNVGGKENINGLTHCITRLRFRLKDESIANDDVLKNMDGVVTVMHSAGQYQVVIGNHVPAVYADVCEIAGIQNDKASEDSDSPKGAFNKIIDIISGCFQPVLGPMCAAGIIKGLNALLTFLLGASFATTGTSIVLNAIGDAVFFFMPIILGFTSAKKFNVNQITGMVIGAALCYSTIQGSALSALGDAIGTLPIIGDYYTTFLGIPLVGATYTSSVFPIVVIMAFAGVIQKYAKKFVPEMLQGFFVPFFVLLISLPVGLLVIGPVITFLTNVLNSAFTIIYEFSPIAMGILVGFCWQLLVIFGLHWALVPIMIVNVATFGFDNAIQGMFGASFAQIAVVAAMYFKLKDKKLKALCPPAVISGICGVTEPAIYGITLPKKTPFIFSLIGGAAGGAVMGAMKAKAYISGGLGIFGVVNYISPEGDASGMWTSIIALTVSVIVGFVLTILFWNDDSETVEEKKTEKKLEVKNDVVVSPLTGKIVPLSNLKDDAFAKGVLGNGLGIEPTSGKVVAPVDGTVTTLFPTLHAIGFTADSGVEVLVHIGLDTVQLEGKGFTAHIKEGDKVKKGQHILDIDLDFIKNAGYSTQTPIVITNTADLLDVIPSDKGEVKCGEELINIVF